MKLIISAITMNTSSSRWRRPVRLSQATQVVSFSVATAVATVIDYVIPPGQRHQSISMKETDKERSAKRLTADHELHRSVTISLRCSPTCVKQLAIKWHQIARNQHNDQTRRAEQRTEKMLRPTKTNYWNETEKSDRLECDCLLTINEILTGSLC